MQKDMALLDDPFIKELVDKEDVFVLTKYFFGIELTKSQEKIVKAIAYTKHKRVVISALTRYGKSYSVSIGINLYIALHDVKRVLLVAPSNEQSAIIRNYSADFIVSSPQMIQLIDFEAKGKDKLKREVSKKRITFNNGCELKVLSAEGKATRLMGHGGDLIILDESCLIPHSVYRQKISRMLGDDPNSVLIEIGNPWHKHNQMWKHWNDPKFLKIHIDWRIALAEGRISQEFVDEQKADLTKREFTVLYDALFPGEDEDALIHHEWIENAIKRKFDWEAENVYIGVDVARFGVDKTVISIMEEKAGMFRLIYIEAYGKKDTTYTYSRLIQLNDEYKPTKILVDDLGLGGGLTDQLNNSNLRSKTVEFISSAKSEFDDVDDKRFPNNKSKYYLKLSKLFERGMISIALKKKEIEQLVLEMDLLRYKHDSKQRIVILDRPEEDEVGQGKSKSPDHADSLMIACSNIGSAKKGRVMFSRW